MRKLFALMVVAALLATTALTGCSSASTNKDNDSSSQVTGTIAATEEKTEAPTEVPTEVETKSAAISPGNFVEHDNFKISFEMAKQYDEIPGDSEYITAKPSEGKKYLVLFFEIENVSKEDQKVNMFYNKAYLDDYEIEQKMLLVNPEDYKMLSGDLPVGKKLKGYVAYEVDPDWQKLEFTYTDGISSSDPRYDFVVTPDQLS